MMKKFLFLDDNENRHTEFRLTTIGCEVTHVKTVAEACSALALQHFDCAFLDHDLQLLKRGQAEETGEDVAKYIAQLPKEKQPSAIVIHSWNIEGAKKMAKILLPTGIPVHCIPSDTEQGSTWFKIEQGKIVPTNQSFKTPDQELVHHYAHYQTERKCTGCAHVRRIKVTVTYRQDGSVIDSFAKELCKACELEKAAEKHETAAAKLRTSAAAIRKLRKL